jgi:hypothetical protein
MDLQTVGTHQMIISIKKLRITINRNGISINVAAKKPQSKFSKIPRQPKVIIGNPEELVDYKFIF